MPRRGAKTDAARPASQWGDAASPGANVPDAGDEAGVTDNSEQATGSTSAIVTSPVRKNPDQVDESPRPLVGQYPAALEADQGFHRSSLETCRRGEGRGS